MKWFLFKMNVYFLFCFFSKLNKYLFTLHGLECDGGQCNVSSVSNDDKGTGLFKSLRAVWIVEL